MSRLLFLLLTISYLELEYPLNYVYNPEFLTARTAKEDFHIKQMSPVLQEAITKRKMDIRILKPGKIEISNNTLNLIKLKKLHFRQY